MAAEELDDEGERFERPEERGVGPAGFARRLVRERRRSRVPPPLRRVPADEDPAERRMPWSAELLKRESVAFLVREGGWRKRQVVVGERRREGRVWDEGVWEKLQVSFGPSALLLLEAAMAADPEALPPVSPALAKTAQSLGSGDLFALHLVVEPLLASAGSDRRGTGRHRDAAPARPREADALRAPLEGLLKALGAAGRWGAVVRDEGAIVVQAGDAQYATTPDVARGVIERAGTTPHVWSEGGSWVQRLRLIVRRWPAQGLALLVAVPQARTRVDLEAATLREALDALEGAIPGARPSEDGAKEKRRQALLRLSPLTLLFRPQELGALDPVGARTCDAARGALAPLFQGDRPALLTWLDETLARAWIREEELRQGLPPASVGAAWNAAGRGLLALAAAAESRPDALRPLIRFYDDYLVRFGTRAPVVQAVQARAEALDRASDRDALRHSAALLFAPGRAITAAGERALSRAFVDRTEPERAFLVDYHEAWRQIGPEVEAIRRELAGEVG